jgi:gamma-glutamyltranspeptidase/glutathione hydrolase
MYIADPDVIHVPVSGLLDKRYLEERAALINTSRDMGKAVAGTPPVEHASLDFAPQRSPQIPGTSHLSVVDAEGEAVSMTTTIEAPFGSELMAKGFLLNNQLTDFSLEPVRDGKPVANAPGPGKRPMSAMSPTIVFDRNGAFKIAIGSPGGPIIIDYVTQALIAMLDGGLGPQAAAALPHIANPNGSTILETNTSVTEFASQLTAMGHKVVFYPLESGLHIVEQAKQGYVGGADPRRDGNVLGN